MTIKINQYNALQAYMLLQQLIDIDEYETKGITRKFSRTFQTFNNVLGKVGDFDDTIEMGFEIRAPLLLNDQDEIRRVIHFIRHNANRRSLQTLLFGWAKYLEYRDDFAPAYMRGVLVRDTAIEDTYILKPVVSFKVIPHNDWYEDEESYIALPVITFKLPSMTEIEQMSAKRKIAMMQEFNELLWIMRNGFWQAIQEGDRHIEWIERDIRVGDFTDKMFNLTSLFCDRTAREPIKFQGLNAVVDKTTSDIAAAGRELHSLTVSASDRKVLAAKLSTMQADLNRLLVLKAMIDAALPDPDITSTSVIPA